MMKKLHLVCNAHLDPVWLWRWDEGAAEAISTFRVAADFCDEYDGFAFNHNEAVLYEWIEEYDPTLFTRIQKLVKDGKWHIMGGWYLQPDCNMISGEGMLRQVEHGRKFFKEKFGVVPKAALNFDSFGHTKGLVQILKKTGYLSYLFCRPLKIFDGKIIEKNDWDYDTFNWVGYDNSEIIGHRNYSIYCTKRGAAVEKIEEYLADRPNLDTGFLLWGIGNHGGGPSKIDMERIAEFAKKHPEIEILHSDPDTFFDEVKDNVTAKRVSDINTWAPGGYTTQAEIKRRYRMLESELFSAEKMLSASAITNNASYDEVKLKEAEVDMLFSQFHDIMPGTLIPSAMDDALTKMSHATEILAKLKTRAFFSLCKGQEKANEGEIPVMAYNPHPYEVEDIFNVEFNLADQHPKTEFLLNPVVYCDGELIPSQLEQEASSMITQWRRNLVFKAKLKPMQITRFDCKIVKEEIPADPSIAENIDVFEFDNGEISVSINTKTGLMDKFVSDGQSYLKQNAFSPLIIADDHHSIATFAHDFSEVIDKFELMNEQDSAEFAGVAYNSLKPVHIIEDGAVRTVVEALFKYNNSALCMRYYLPKQGKQVRVELILHWNEKEKMLKLSLPTSFENSKYMAQAMDGYDNMYSNGDEVVAQKWTASVDTDKGKMLALINDCVYGSSFSDGEIRMTLVRSPRYGCLTMPNGGKLMYNRGYVPHTDQAVHEYNFYLQADDVDTLLPQMERLAQIKHENPYILSFFPQGEGEKPCGMFKLSDDRVVMKTFKKGMKNDTFVTRLYNPYEKSIQTDLEFLGKKEHITLSAFEIKTLVINTVTNEISETDMLQDEYDFSEV